MLLLIVGESISRLYLGVATPPIIYGAVSIFASKMIKIVTIVESIYSLYRSVLFMQDSHCLMAPQVAYSAESLVDDTDTGSSDFASFT